VSADPTKVPVTLCFGKAFELDLRAYELRSSGHPVKLERIPMEVLRFLLERPGELVTREQIAEKIWGKDVFLDTDNSINGAIRRSGRC
jgi:DNA-binding response OmpR family regulator